VDLDGDCEAYADAQYERGGDEDLSKIEEDIYRELLGDDKDTLNRSLQPTALT
jgi:hypothetical protein